jgi:phage-related tail fiber protein
MPFDQNNLPEWNAPGVEPPQSKKDSGWGVIEKPPADWFNWFFNKTYNALKSLFTNAQHKEEKGQPNGYASLDENAKVPTSQLPIATTTSPGAISASDKAKLDGIAPGAEVNQNAFSNVKVGATTIAADSKTDTLELVAGNAVTITPDATNDRITIAVPNATTSTPGAMSAADKSKLDGIQSGAEPNQNAFSNVKVGTTTIAADSKTDTLELVAGANIVLTPDAANDKVTIDVTGVAPASHTHPFSDITNKPTTVDGYGITDAVKTSDVVTSPAPNKILKLDANGKLPTSITGNADGNAATATKLQTARTISLTGDATGSTSFDGSANASIAVTLANTGVTPGTYPKVTVDAKGRVTGGQALSPSDIPNLDWSKITSGKPTTLAGYGITDAVNILGYITSNTSITDVGKWTKIASVTITSQYADAQAYINAIGYGSGGTSSRFKAFFRVKQQAPLGSAPLIELILSGESYRVTNNDLVAVTTVNTASQTVVELYLRINQSYEQIAIQPEQTSGTGSSVVFYSSQGFVASLPSGTQTVASYDSYNGNAATATKLQTARTISLSGDVTGSASFDGSANATISATLANSGVTPGTYPKVTVDAKGRVTAGSSLSPTDIPNLDWSKITTGKPTTLAGYGITDAIPANQKGAANGVASLDGGAKVPTSQLPSASTSAAGIVQLNDTVTSTSTTQAATARAVKQAYDLANAAIPSSQKGQPNGVATLGPDGKVPASQLNISTSANAITITDSGGYYTSGNVEGALQEIGQVLNAMRGDLITSVNNVLNM